jgi:hypothetical protein
MSMDTIVKMEGKRHEYIALMIAHVVLLIGLVLTLRAMEALCRIGYDFQEQKRCESLFHAPMAWGIGVLLVSGVQMTLWRRRHINGKTFIVNLIVEFGIILYPFLFPAQDGDPATWQFLFWIILVLMIIQMLPIAFSRSVNILNNESA